jgi:hypothetical protein
MSYNTRYQHNYQATGDAILAIPNCSHQVPPNARYCPTCGKPVGTVDLDHQIANWIKDRRAVKNDEFMFGWDYPDACSWYFWMEDMVMISKAFPTVLFEITGAGEEAGDLWRAHFLNGRYCKQHAVFPDFSTDLLEKYPTT